MGEQIILHLQMCDTTLYYNGHSECFNPNHICATVLATKSATNYSYMS